MLKPVLVRLALGTAFALCLHTATLAQVSTSTGLRQTLNGSSDLPEPGRARPYEQFLDAEGRLPQPRPVFDEPLTNEDGEPIDEFNAPEDTLNDPQQRENRPVDPLVNGTGLQESPVPSDNARARRAPQVSIINAAGEVSPLANTPVRPVQSGNGRSANDPFAPLGIRAGSLLLFPSLTQTLGYTSNADFTEGGSESYFSITEGRLRAVSDWALHELSAELGGSYQTFFNGTSEDLPRFDALAQMRLDHTRDFQSTFGARFEWTTESADSTNLVVPAPAVVTGRPDVLSYGGFAQTEKRFGRVSARLRGSVDHTQYEDASLSDGSSLSQSDRTNTLLLASLRLSSETTPAFQPFGEVQIGSRIYDTSVDRNGLERDSFVAGLRGGVAFNRGDKLNGEIALGYRNETFDDAALDDLSGVTVDATINWSPVRLTMISATAQTAFTPSVNPGESGSITYAGTIGVTRDVRPNLSLNARLLASLRDFEGSSREETTWQATAGAEWRLNRMAAITAQLGYETVDSTEPGSSYDATTAFIGLRLQR